MGSNGSCFSQGALSTVDQPSLELNVDAPVLLGNNSDETALLKQSEMPAGFALSDAGFDLTDDMPASSGETALLKDPLIRLSGFAVTGLSVPGKLGRPSMTLMTEPRMDKALLEFNKKDLIMGKYGAVGKAVPSPVDLSSPLWMQYGWMKIFDQVLFPAMIKNALEPHYDHAAMYPPDLQQLDYTIDGMDGNQVKVYCAKPQGSSKHPAIVHLHGGGMCIGDPANLFFHMQRVNMAKEGFIVFSVDFRNSCDRHSYPAGLNNCMSCLAWVHENREKLGISKIILSGDSGGGNLSVCMAIRAKREGKLCMVDGVFACCPFTTGLAAQKNASSNSSLLECKGYWVDSVVGLLFANLYDPSGAHENDPCAWPCNAQNTDLEGLPPHFLNLNELDPLRDPGLEYAQKLEDASVRVASNVVEGTPHSGDLLTKHIPGAEHFQEQFLSNLRSFAESL